MATRVIATMRLRAMSTFDEAVLAALRKHAPVHPQPTHFLRNVMLPDPATGRRYPMLAVRAALRRLVKWGKAEETSRVYRTDILHWRAAPEPAPAEAPEIPAHFSQATARAMFLALAAAEELHQCGYLRASVELLERAAKGRDAALASARADVAAEQGA